MNARQPRAEYRKLARIAEYTAQIARRLADNEDTQPHETHNQVRALKASVGRERAQLDTILRYLSHNDALKYIEVELKTHGVTIRHCICPNDAAHAESRDFQPHRLSAKAMRKAVGDALIKRHRDEDPDWIGSALCDLDFCETEKDFYLWAEENGFEGIEEMLCYRGVEDE